MRIEEVNSDCISYFRRKLISITEDKLEALSSDYIYALLEISCKIIQYYKSTHIHESYTNRNTLKSLSDTIFFYNYLLNYHFPLTSPSQINLDGYNFHQLEEIAAVNQEEIYKYVDSVSRIKTSAHHKLGPVLRNLKIILDKPRFGLMLFEYSSGIPAFFSHDEGSVKMHKHALSLEVSDQLSELISRYGNGIVDRIIQTRKKWDFEYAATFEKMSKEVETRKRYNTEDMSEGMQAIPKERVQSMGAKLINSLNTPHGFKEGKEMIAKDLVRVDMSASLDKCRSAGLRYYTDDIEINFNF